jgi:hypothetical protein
MPGKAEVLLKAATTRIRLESGSSKPTSSAERQAPRSRIPNCVVAILPSFRCQFTVMVNSIFDYSSIRQPTVVV